MISFWVLWHTARPTLIPGPIKNNWNNITIYFFQFEIQFNCLLAFWEISFRFLRFKERPILIPTATAKKVHVCVNCSCLCEFSNEFLICLPPIQLQLVREGIYICNCICIYQWMCWQIYMRIATAFVCMCALAGEWHNSFKTICKDLYLLKTRMGINERIEKKYIVYGLPVGSK